MRMTNPAKTPMLSPYDMQAAKRAANLSVNGDLLSKAKDLDINLSATLEQALAEALKIKLREIWLAQNQAAMLAYNRYVDEQGVFSDGVRSF